MTIPLFYTVGLIMVLINYSLVYAETSPVISEQSANPRGNYKPKTDRSIFDQRNEIDGLVKRAAHLRNAGQIGKNLEVLKIALALAEESGDPTRLAAVLIGISDSYLLLRQSQKAEDFADKSLKLAASTGSLTLIASSLNQLGHVHMARKRFRSAVKIYRDGISKASGDPPLTAKLLINLIRAYQAANEPKKAETLVTAALSSAEEQPDSRDKAYSLIAIADIIQQLEIPQAKSFQMAFTILNRAQEIGDSLGDARSQSYALGQMALLYQTAKRYADANALYHRALFFATQQSAPEMEARWNWGLAKVYKAQDRIQKALQYYKNSIIKLQGIQHALVYGLRGQPDFFSQSVGSVYREYADLILKEADQTKEKNKKKLLLREVRNVMEGYKTVQLRDYFRDECVTAQQERNASVEIDELIKPGIATLYPIVFPDRLVILLSLSNGELDQFTVPVEKGKLEKTVSVYLSDLSVGRNPRRLRENGETLYKWLIKPVHHKLKKRQIHTLVVIPDGILRTIPYSALYNGKTFLINEFAIAISPGLTLTDSQLLSPRNHRILLNGLSVEVQGYSALPYVDKEVDEIASLFNSTLLLNADFQSEKIESKIKENPFSIISFSTHSSFESDPRQSFLLTYDGKLSLDELEGLVSLSGTREQPVDLLVLSACETALGDERAALGFAGVAVKAGARSALASLWLVNDASTSLLIPSFFEYLLDAKFSKARALQLAQIKLANDPRYNHPYYWAAFVLIGNWF